MQLTFSDYICAEFPAYHRYAKIFNLPYHIQIRIFRRLEQQAQLWNVRSVSIHFDLTNAHGTGDYLMALEGWTIVRCRLTSSDEKQFEKWLDEQKKLKTDPISELAAKGLKLSLTWVDSSNAFCASVTDRDHKKTLTSWSDSWLEAFWIALYKVNVVYGGEQWYDRGAATWG